MSSQHDDRENRNRYRVPLEQANMTTDIEVREERHREIALGVERNTARDVARSCTEKNREKKIGKNEIEIPISLPEAVIDVPADFDRDNAQNQAPQNQKQSHIINGELRRHHARKGR